MSMWRSGQLLSRGLITGAARVIVSSGAASPDWHTTSRQPVGLAPDPVTTPEPVVQVYGARCSRWRGYFGVHTWIAVKPVGARSYTVYEVLGSRFRRTGSALAIRKRAPDMRWFGHVPELLAEKRAKGPATKRGRTTKKTAKKTTKKTTAKKAASKTAKK